MEGEMNIDAVEERNSLEDRAGRDCEGNVLTWRANDGDGDVFRNEGERISATGNGYRRNKFEVIGKWGS